MSAKPESAQSPDLLGYENGRCSQCGGASRLWPDRWYCTECGYFDLTKSSAVTYRDSFGEWQETESFEALAEKAHFWARHAMGTSASHKAEALGHAAMCMTRALRILANRLQAH